MHGAPCPSASSRQHPHQLWKKSRTGRKLNPSAHSCEVSELDLDLSWRPWEPHSTPPHGSVQQWEGWWVSCGTTWTKTSITTVSLEEAKPTIWWKKSVRTKSGSPVGKSSAGPGDVPGAKSLLLGYRSLIAWRLVSKQTYLLMDKKDFLFLALPPAWWASRAWPKATGKWACLLYSKWNSSMFDIEIAYHLPTVLML